MYRELVVGVNKPCNLMEWTSELRTEQFNKSRLRRNSNDKREHVFMRE